MPHQRLLTKVKAHGIDGNVYDWIKACLSGREQKVQIKGKKSNSGTVNSGTPRDPYLAHYFYGISSKISKFVDDTKIGRQISLD